MTPIFLLALMCAFPAVTHLYPNEELLANQDLQVDNRRSTDSDEHQNVFKVDQDLASDEGEHDYDDGNPRRKARSLHIQGNLATSSKNRYQMDAMFIPIRARSRGLHADAQCDSKSGNDTKVTADLKVVKKVGIRTTYKLTISLTGTGIKSLIAKCYVKANNGKLFKLSLSLKRLEKNKSSMLASRRRISARHAQLYSNEKDKAMVYSPRETPLLIGEGI